MKITPTQRALIEHRLSLGAELFAEVFADTEHLEAIAKNCDAAWDEVNRAVSAGAIEPEKLTPCALEILCDCLDGSTFFADQEDHIAEGQMTKSQYRTAHKAADDLEAAIFTATGRRVNTVRS